MRRSKIDRLPREVREWLDRKIVERSFSDYDGLAALLAEHGYRISASGLQRHGQRFAEQLAALKLATEQARAVVAETADEAGAMSDALTRLMQQKIFDLLVDLEAEEIGEGKLANLAKGVAALARATVTQRQWAAKVRETLERQRSAASAELGEVARARADAGGRRFDPAHFARHRSAQDECREPESWFNGPLKAALTKGTQNGRDGYGWGQATGLSGERYSLDPLRGARRYRARRNRL
jgi:hypothetical protein